jgi:hypothetical protein
MRRVIRFALPAALTALIVAGCGDKKNEGTPNPDLKVPDVPPGGHGSKGELKDMNKKGK